MASTQVQPLAYTSPEELAGKYSFQADMWAFGVVLKVILTGDGVELAQLLNKEQIEVVLKKEFEGEKKTFAMQCLVKCCRGLLKKNPHERTTVREIKQQLRVVKFHEFKKEFNAPELEEEVKEVCDLKNVKDFEKFMALRTEMDSECGKEAVCLMLETYFRGFDICVPEKILEKFREYSNWLLFATVNE